MRTFTFIVGFLLCLPRIVAGAEPLDSQWRTLLGETLEGWEVYTGVPHKSVSVPGFPQSTSEDSKGGTPVGLGDPMKIYTIEMVEGQPVLHVSGQIFAGLTSMDSFQNYHLTLEYKWGEKKLPPRVHKKRDSGLLFHCNGEHGAFWNVWMQCLECQIQETDTADLYLLAGTSAKVHLDAEAEGKPTYLPSGEERAIGNGTKAYGSSRCKNYEIANDWNRVDVLTVGDQAVFAVNGHVVMRLTDAKSGNQAHGKPLTSGRLQIQSEGAEIFYRDIRMRSIQSLPEGDRIESSKPVATVEAAS